MPLAARAQQPAMPVIGWLSSTQTGLSAPIASSSGARARSIGA